MRSQRLPRERIRKPFVMLQRLLGQTSRLLLGGQVTRNLDPNLLNHQCFGQNHFDLLKIYLAWKERQRNREISCRCLSENRSRWADSRPVTAKTFIGRENWHNLRLRIGELLETDDKLTKITLRIGELLKNGDKLTYLHHKLANYLKRMINWQKLHCELAEFMKMMINWQNLHYELANYFHQF